MRVFALVALLLPACFLDDRPVVVGDAGDGTLDGRLIDGHNGDGDPCEPRHTIGTAHVHLESGTSNASTDCLMAGCHRPGGTAPIYGMAGTILRANGSPNGGVTVTLLQKVGPPLQALSDNAGNFWFQAAIAFPVNARVSVCPTTASMNTTIEDNSPGSCNSCHDPNSPIGAVTIE